MPKYWLFKTEPSTYSFVQLKKDGKTNWNGVRNFQARNFLKEVAVGDIAVIYHSGDEKSAVGLAKVTRAGYPDPDPKKAGDWVQLDLVYEETLARPVPLKEIKSVPALADISLIKQSRLSCMPITANHFQTLVKLGRQK